MCNFKFPRSHIKKVKQLYTPIKLNKKKKRLKRGRCFSHSSVGKESDYNAGNLGSIPGSGGSPGEGNGNPLQYPCLENPMDRGAWQATVHGVVRVGHDLAIKPAPRLKKKKGTKRVEWTNYKVLLYSTGNYIQCPVINHHGKEYEKEYRALLWWPSG